MAIKILGGRDLPSYWARFDRLQRTAYKLGLMRNHPRGLFRFSSHQEMDEPEGDPSSEPPRPPGEAVLISLCRALNENGARYAIAAMATIITRDVL